MDPEPSDTPIDRRTFLGATGLILGGLGVDAAEDSTLPPGVKAVWDLAKAHRESTATRERVCLNGRKVLASDARAIGQWVTEPKGRVLAVGLDQAEMRSFLPVPVDTKKGEHIAAHFEPPGRHSPFAGVGPADLHNRDPRPVPLVTGGAEAVGNGVLARAAPAAVVFCQLAPWQFDPTRAMNQKRTFRRLSYLVTRLATNLGAMATTPVLDRFARPAKAGERRWLDGLYLDVPEEWDDPYRFFRW